MSDTTTETLGSTAIRLYAMLSILEEIDIEAQILLDEGGRIVPVLTPYLEQCRLLAFELADHHQNAELEKGGQGL